MFLPTLFGSSAAFWTIVILMAIWYLLSAWNEGRRRAGVLRLYPVNDDGYCAGKIDLLRGQ